MILPILRIFIYMGELKKTKEKKVKISITICPDLDKRMEGDLINKSRLIEKLIREYYDNKNLR